MSDSRIPEKQAEYNIYIIALAIYLNSVPEGETLKRGILLGMLAAEMTTLNEFRASWSSEDPDHLGVYDILNDPTKCTKVTPKLVAKHQYDFGVFMRPILDRISGSPFITPADRLVLHIAEPVTTHSHINTPIPFKPTIGIEVLGGGALKISIRAAHDATRASIPEGADAIELAYRDDPPTVTVPPTNTEPPLVTKAKQMTSPEDGAKTLISTKAIFQMNFGVDHGGNHFQCFARFINTKRPDRNGLWTGPVGENIS